MKKIDIFDFHPDGVVVDAGDFPKNPLALSMIDSVEKVVCCDGATDDFVASGRIPWRIVGDGDSISQALLAEFKDIFRPSPDQETNDQTKAVNYLRNHGCKRIAIVGATGKREDHMLGNVSLLVEYLKAGLEARIYTDHGVFIPCNGNCEVECLPKTQVSVFNFGARSMTSLGLKWPLRDFSNWWQGTLNEAPSGLFSVKAEGDYILFVTYRPKSERN